MLESGLGEEDTVDVAAQMRPLTSLRNRALLVKTEDALDNETEDQLHEGSEHSPDDTSDRMPDDTLGRCEPVDDGFEGIEVRNQNHRLVEHQPDTSEPWNICQRRCRRQLQ